MTHRYFTLAATAAVALALCAPPAGAACVTKGAVATSSDEKSAKWFALETMVQSVSWALWPSYVATNTVPGYKISNQKYHCSPDTGGVTCRGQATFCPTKG